MLQRRTAKSTRSDNTEMDTEGTESDMAKLQRQVRIMERDRKAYHIKAREQIRKQQQEIETLLKEQEELHRNLGACKSLSRQHQDVEHTQSLQALLEQRDMIEKEMETEKQSQKQLQAEISSVEVKLAELRKGVISSNDSQSSEARKTQKGMLTLEYKLERASTRFNEQVTKNSHLKEELQTLQMERAHFQQLHNRLNKELQEINKSIEEILNLSAAAYDAREEAQSKKNMMRDKAAKDLIQYNTKMKELERIIAQEFNLKEFMSTKCSGRMEEDGEHEVTSRQLPDLKEQKEVDSGDEPLDSLEEVFEQIQTVTGEDNLDLLVSRFIQVKDRNFALFNFVNEQKNEAETLRNQISQIQNEMKQFQLKGLQWEQHHHSLMRDVDKQRKEIESQAEIHENQASAKNNILDEIKAGVNSIFSKMDCDRSVIEDKLGSSKGITENNIMFYLGLVEQKTNELLTIHTFLNSKDLKKERNSKDVAKFILGQNPDVLQQNLSIQPAVKSEAEEDPLADEEERPLSRDELRRKIMKGVLQTESLTSQGATKASKFSRQPSGKQHAIEDEIITSSFVHKLKLCKK